MRRSVRSVAIVLALGCAACTSDALPDIAHLGEIRRSIRPADPTRRGGDSVARAEASLPRAGFVLVNAAMAHAGRACPDAGAEPLAGIPIVDEARRYRVVEYAFRCRPRQSLPNDAAVPAEIIAADRWPEVPAGLRQATLTMRYDYPRMRPQAVFGVLAGVAVTNAQSTCGGGRFVVERLESRTQAPRPKPGDGPSLRMHGVRLLYRCLADSTVD